MNILLLIAHGSRRDSANQEILELGKRIQQHQDNDFDSVVPAFLEIAEPDIAAGIDQCVDMGATSITVLPYFLSLGKHVARDIPEALDIAKKKHPNMEIRMTQHFGASNSIVDSVISCANSTA